MNFYEKLLFRVKQGENKIIKNELVYTKISARHFHIVHKMAVLSKSNISY